MKQSFIIQCARDDRYNRLIDLTEEHHRAYCERHKFQYLRLQGDWAVGWEGYWDWFVVMLVLLEAGAEFVARIDADAFIVGDEDLRKALSCSDVGMVKHRASGNRIVWNTGVMYVRNSARSRAFLRAILDSGPGGPPWWDNQAVIDLMATGVWDDVVEQVPDKWNSTFRVNEAENPVVMAWHGVPWNAREKLMSAYVNTFGGQYNG